jgi:hypothetical protein
VPQMAVKNSVAAARYYKDRPSFGITISLRHPRRSEERFTTLVSSLLREHKMRENRSPPVGLALNEAQHQSETSEEENEREDQRGDAQREGRKPAMPAKPKRQDEDEGEISQRQVG